MTRRRRKLSSGFVDWLAVFVTFTSFIFLIAWQSWPDSDYMDQALPILVRTLLVALPLTAGMWGVARATRGGSAVPKYMSKQLPYAQVNPQDGTVAGTTYQAQHTRKAQHEDDPAGDGMGAGDERQASAGGSAPLPGAD